MRPGTLCQLASSLHPAKGQTTRTSSAKFCIQAGLASIVFEQQKSLLLKQGLTSEIPETCEPLIQYKSKRSLCTPGPSMSVCAFASLCFASIVPASSSSRHPGPWTLQLPRAGRSHLPSSDMQRKPFFQASTVVPRSCRSTCTGVVQNRLRFTLGRHLVHEELC